MLPVKQCVMDISLRPSGGLAATAGGRRWQWLQTPLSLMIPPQVHAIMIMLPAGQSVLDVSFYKGGQLAVLLQQQEEHAEGEGTDGASSSCLVLVQTQQLALALLREAALQQGLVQVYLHGLLMYVWEEDIDIIQAAFGADVAAYGQQLALMLSESGALMQQRLVYVKYVCVYTPARHIELYIWWCRW